MKMKCENCNWKGPEEKTKDAQDVEMRHSVGCLYSDRECPKCGALCYPADQKDSYPWGAFVRTDSPSYKELVAALGSAVAEWAYLFPEQFDNTQHEQQSRKNLRDAERVFTKALKVLDRERKTS